MSSHSNDENEYDEDVEEYDFSDYSSDSGSEGQTEDEESNASLLQDTKRRVDEIERKRTEFLDKIKLIITKEEQDGLYRLYKEYIGPHDKRVTQNIPQATRSILSRIATNGNTDQEHPGAWVVNRLAGDYPELLEDPEAVQAFYTAVKEKQIWFIKKVLDSNVPPERLRRILDPSSDDTGANKSKIHSNCIIQAVKNDLEATLTIRLIRAASEHSLKTQDGFGMTALHYAVQSQKCKGEQIKVVQALIDHGDSVLDKYNGENQSVFEYHLASRTKKTPDKRKSSSRKTGRTDQDEDLCEVGDEKDFSKGPIESQKGPMWSILIESDDEGTPNLRMSKENEMSALDSSSSEMGDITILATLGGRGPEFFYRRSRKAQCQPNEELPKDAREEVQSTQEQKKELSKRPHSGWDEVANLLKLHFLRNTFLSQSDATEYPRRNHDDAVRFLLGDNPQNKNLSFAFPAKRQKSIKFDFEDFEKGYSSVLFDDTLLYVSFGVFDLANQENEHQRSQNNGVGKRDLGKFFEWLSKKKRVQYIIKVIVAENDDLSHCDNTIIEALRNFQVEILDWQKIDLCPSVIQEATKQCSNLHELHLRWSGSNAVLRAWSEPQGLATLRNLKTIHIYEAKMPLDSPKYIKNKIDEFMTRLNSAREHLELTCIDEGEHHPFNQSGFESKGKLKSRARLPDKTKTSERIDEHQWLNIMDTFVHGISTLDARNLLRCWGGFSMDQTIWDTFNKGVTVALIDDGVDFLNPAVLLNLAGGKCFPSEFGDYEVAGAPDPPFHGSTTDHGTKMAYFIQRICPAVKIFVCKIDMMQRPGKKANFTAKSAADAVEYAVEKGFDIISMSWSIEKDDTDANQREHLERIKQALIPKSNTKMPLVFCSAPDIGQVTTDNKYVPFGCRDIKNVFRIGAATADGLKYRRTGDDVDYILPGENVTHREGDNIDLTEGDGPMTGSSVATALAAGLAALIIDCVRLGAIYNASRGNKTGVSYKTLEVVKTYEVMKNAFDIVKAKGASGGSEKRLGVENFFKRPSQELKQSEKDARLDPRVSKWEAIEKIARDLVPSKFESL